MIFLMVDTMISFLGDIRGSGISAFLPYFSLISVHAVSLWCFILEAGPMAVGEPVLRSDWGGYRI